MNAAIADVAGRGRRRWRSCRRSRRSCRHARRTSSRRSSPGRRRLRDRPDLRLQARPERLPRDARAGFDVHSLSEIIAFNAANAAGVEVRPGSSRSRRIRSTSPRAAPTPLHYTAVSRAGHRQFSAARSIPSTTARTAVQGTADDFDALLFSANTGAGHAGEGGLSEHHGARRVRAARAADREPLPVGRDLLRPRVQRAALIGLAYAYEQATRHRQPPASTPPLPTDTVRRP